VILSCDRYSDLWHPLIRNITTMFVECPFPIYLVSNEKAFIYSGVINIQTGFDKDWSTSFKAALAQIPENQLLILLDDMPFYAKPNFVKINAYFDILEEYRLGILHLRPMPPQRYWHRVHESWFEYGTNDSYTANVYGMWNKGILESVLKEGESPWDFEVYGSQRLNKIAKSGAITQEALSYSNLVIKGFWAKRILQINEELNLGLDLNARKQQTDNKIFERLKELIFYVVLKFLPRNLQNWIFKLFRNLSKN
jgi:hypothetical protein